MHVLPRRHRLPGSAASRPVAIAALGALAGLLVVGCGAGSATPTPPIEPGSSDAPRELNLIMRDYAYTPTVVDWCPGRPSGST